MWEMNKRVVISFIEEPNDGTRYNHVFEFSWDLRQFKVHRHAFDHGCTLADTETAFDTEPLLELAEKIRGKSRSDFCQIITDSDYYNAVIPSENPNTVGSIIRCLARAMDALKADDRRLP